VISHFDDPNALSAWVQDLKARKHNLPKDQAQAEMHDEMEERWNQITADIHDYRRGGFLLEGSGPFNVQSLGNWITLAQAANVPFVPASYLGSIDMIDFLRGTDQAFSARAEDLPAEVSAALGGVGPGSPPSSDRVDMDARARTNVTSLHAALEDFDGPVFVRGDGAASGSVKQASAQGLLLEEAPGGCGTVVVDGRRQVDLLDERLADAIMGWPEPDMPFWARPMVKARRIQAKDGSSFPAEYRVFVADGEVVAASTYYPQAPRPIDEADQMGLWTSLTYSQMILDLIQQQGVRPHHPRFELRDGFDKARMHCSLDFLETADGEVVFLEGGPPHLRKPAWGAHPCAFTTLRDGQFLPLAASPEGIAWGGGRFESRAALDSRMQHVREFLAKARAANAQEPQP
jgi:hypothetical protein